MNRIPLLIAAAMCFLALEPGWPYGYFTLLRFAVCGVGIYAAVQMFEAKRERWAWACVVLAVLFNPIFKVHLGRDLWAVVDVAAGVFLCALAWKSRR